MKILKMSYYKYFLLAVIVSFGVTACSNNDDSSEPMNETANLTVRMTDAPGDYDAVKIDVQDVEIHVEAEGAVEGDEDGDGWISVGNVQTGVYDLLELTGGVSQLLADTEVPAGYVSQMRLVLGDENSVVIDGETMPLNTPSAQQSGLKIQLNQQFEAGESYAFLLDFNVDESIVTTGNGSYSLKPVIRASAEAGASTVIGTVSPSEYQSLVILSNAEVTISAYTDANGNFSLKGVPAGTYSLTVIPDDLSGLSQFEIATVEVEANETVELDPINL